MPDHDCRKQHISRPHLWLIAVVGVIAPRRLRADWRQEWEAELRYREELLADLGPARLAKQIRPALAQSGRVPGRAGFTTTKIGGQDVSRLSIWRANAAQRTRLHLDRIAYALPGHRSDLGGFQPDPGRIVDAAAV
jgi:hypothetical protein